MRHKNGSLEPVSGEVRAFNDFGNDFEGSVDRFAPHDCRRSDPIPKS